MLSKKPRLAAFGGSPSAGTEEVVTLGSAGEPGGGGAAVGCSGARFGTASGAGFGTSAVATGTVAAVGAGFGTLVTAGFSIMAAGSGFGGLVATDLDIVAAASGFGALAFRVAFVATGLGRLAFDLSRAAVFVAGFRTGGLSSCSSCRTVGARASALAGAGFRARYS